MKKSSIYLVAALAVLVGLLALNNTMRKKASLGVSALSADMATSTRFFKVETNEDTASLAMSGSVWVTSDNEFPADTAKVNKVLKAIFELKSDELVSRNPDRASEYGLDSTAVKIVTLLDGGGKQLARVAIGKTSSADWNSTFWKMYGSNKVYRTLGNIGSDLSGKINDWKDKKLYAFKKEEVKSMDVTWRDTLGVLTSFAVQVKEDGTWETVAPEYGNAKKSPVDVMASRFEQLTIDEFPTQDDNTVVTHTPDLAVKVLLKDGQEHQLKAQISGNHYYMKHPNRSESVKLSKWRLDVFQKPLSDIFEPIPAEAAEKDTAVTTPF